MKRTVAMNGVKKKKPPWIDVIDRRNQNVVYEREREPGVWVFGHLHLLSPGSVKTNKENNNENEDEGLLTEGIKALYDTGKGYYFVIFLVKLATCFGKNFHRHHRLYTDDPSHYFFLLTSPMPHKDLRFSDSPLKNVVTTLPLRHA